MNTRRRVEWTHTTHHTHHNPPQQHDHNTTRRQRQRKKTETEREEETIGEKTRQEKREKIHFQCGGAGPFLVDGMLCFVYSGCARVFTLRKSVKYDCSLILSVHLGRSRVFF